ncbi:MAG: TIM barrel protein [Lachnospiraceae bacterium]|jgi:hydroxypyruvate isomerase
MRISPCIDTLYKGAELTHALREIKECGFQGYEFWSAHNWDMGEMAEQKEAFGLQLANFNCEPASLADEGQRLLFLKNLEAAVALGKRLGGSRITVLSGDDTGEARGAQHASIVAGLREAAPMLEEEGFMVVLEASNRRVNRPNNYLTSADEAFEIIEEVGSPSVRMLYDIYHQQISEGDLLARILPNLEKIGHFHAAGVPNRHELDQCEINYRFLLQKIRSAGCTCWVGLEYFPSVPVKESLIRTMRYLEQADMNR